MENYKQVCKKCGSDDVMVMRWVNPNTNELNHNQSGTEGLCDWCNNCKNEATLIEVEIPKVRFDLEPPPEGSSWLSFREYEMLKQWESQAMAAMFPDLAEFTSKFKEYKQKKEDQNNGETTPNNP